MTEALKASDQMEWVRRMNSIRSRAEEIVLTELYMNDKMPVIGSMADNGTLSLFFRRYETYICPFQSR